MIRLLLASMSSGSGKTVLTCAFLEALRRRGYKIQAFKCGPDYIDPKFHRMIDGVKSRNLDLFLADLNQDKLKLIYADAIEKSGADAVICEGVMGYYDGLGGVTDQGSAWDTARILRLPALLIVNAKANSLTLAAQIRGLRDFRENNNIIGIFLNACSGDLYKILSPVLERETGLPVLGYLPRMKEAEFKSRHLGLNPPDEDDNKNNILNRFGALALKLEECADLDRLFKLCEDNNMNINLENIAPEHDLNNINNKINQIKIAVARDAALNLIYPENLEILKKFGAEIVFINLLRDKNLPDGIGGLYLPGGYPECHAKELYENSAMREDILKIIQNGLPVVAEGGGFLYLGQEIKNQDGESYRMTGILPGKAFPVGRPVRFGYAYMTAREDSLLFRVGDRVPVHAFHYWDSTENGSDFEFQKPISGRIWRGGFANANLYAAFSRLYFPGRPEIAERFVQAAKKYKNIK